MPLGHYFSPPPILTEDDFKKDPAKSQHRVRQYLETLSRMARGLSFLDNDGGITAGRRCLNIDAVWVNYVSNGVANTEDTVAHNLGRAPIGIWIGVPDKSSIIYSGPTAWTSTNIFLKASAATTTVNILVF